MKYLAGTEIQFRRHGDLADSANNEAGLSAPGLKNSCGLWRAWIGAGGADPHHDPELRHQRLSVIVKLVSVNTPA